MTASTTHRPRRRKRAQPTADPATTGTRRVAIYLRCSTDDEHQPFSIDAQDSALGSYIKSQIGWTHVAAFSDDASGATTNRPDLQRTPAERKAMIEALIAEIRITDNQAIPVFKIPEPDHTIPGDPTATTESNPPVRTMVRLVGRQGLEP